MQLYYNFINMLQINNSRFVQHGYILVMYVMWYMIAWPVDSKIYIKYILFVHFLSICKEMSTRTFISSGTFVV